LKQKRDLSSLYVGAKAVVENSDAMMSTSMCAKGCQGSLVVGEEKNWGVVRSFIFCFRLLFRLGAVSERCG